MSERTFVHADGRTWSAIANGAELTIRITLPEEVPIIRTRGIRDAGAANAALEELCVEQLADGFAETTAPVPLAPPPPLVDTLADRWRAADPVFPIDALLDPLASDEPTRRELIEALTVLLADSADTRLMEGETREVTAFARAARSACAPAAPSRRSVATIGSIGCSPPRQQPASNVAVASARISGT